MRQSVNVDDFGSGNKIPSFHLILKRREEESGNYKDRRWNHRNRAKRYVHSRFPSIGRRKGKCPHVHNMKKSFRVQ
jgi:hypothetical protein